MVLRTGAAFLGFPKSRDEDYRPDYYEYRGDSGRGRDGEVVDVCADPGAVELGVETVGVEDFEVADWCKLESLALVVVSNEPELTRK